jgi:ribosomal protein S18 acetylase RimI-like enzyme
VAVLGIIERGGEPRLRLMVGRLPSEIRFRAAGAADAECIAGVLRASLSSHGWMPVLHTPQEDLAFIRDIVLPHQAVTVAEADGAVVGFIAVKESWIDQLYLAPGWTGRGIGSRLLEQATGGMGEAMLYCFRANAGARRFYERHGFRVAASRSGLANEEGLPDLLYVRR